MKVSKRIVCLAHPIRLARRLVAGHPFDSANQSANRMRYRYYVSRSLRSADRKHASGIRIPARPLEELIMIQLARLFNDPIDLIGPVKANWLSGRCDASGPG